MMVESVDGQDTSGVRGFMKEVVKFTRKSNQRWFSAAREVCSSKNRLRSLLSCVFLTRVPGSSRRRENCTRIHKMSLVDYASSSDDEASEPTGKPSSQPQNQPSPPSFNQTKMASAGPNLAASSSAVPPLSNQTKQSSTESNFYAATSVAPRLPDASLLLNSSTLPVSTGSDHASWVASAVAESASRKRDSNPLPSVPRGKIPKSTLPHTKIGPETTGGMLLPPQLRGRSNVVTEDINKLFVRKYNEPQPGGTQD